MRTILIAAALGAALATAATAQKIESIVVQPQPKPTNKPILPTVALEPAKVTDDSSPDALHCPGNGFVQHAGPPKKDLTVSGQPWLDKIDSETDGWNGEAMLETAPVLRVHPPHDLRAGAWIPLQKGKGDDATLVGTAAGGLRMEYNRYTGDLVIRTSIGRFVGNCRVRR